MAEKTIVTQGQLGDLKSATQQEISSLIFHSGDSMSSAHGLNIMNGPVNDGNGNDLSTYQDSNGDVVGTAMLHVVILGVDYYAPVITTTLDGQSALTGVVPDINALLQPGSNAWVTDYATEATEDAQLALTGLLLPHTRQYYAETHSRITAQSGVTSDSAGHIVGTHVLTCYVGQQKIHIPASTRLGGPAQLPRLPAFGISTQQSLDTNHGEQKRDNEQYVYMWSRPAIGGTLPITFTWQVNYKTDGSGAWIDLPVIGTKTALPTEKPGWYVIVGTTFAAQMFCSDDDWRLMLVVRGKYTNAAGDAYSNLCHFKAKEANGSGFNSPDKNDGNYNNPIPWCITSGDCDPY